MRFVKREVSLVLSLRILCCCCCGSALLGCADDHDRDVVEAPVLVGQVAQLLGGLSAVELLIQHHAHQVFVSVFE